MVVWFGLGDKLLCNLPALILVARRVADIAAAELDTGPEGYADVRPWLGRHDNDVPIVHFGSGFVHDSVDLIHQRLYKKRGIFTNNDWAIGSDGRGVFGEVEYATRMHAVEDVAIQLDELGTITFVM